MKSRLLLVAVGLFVMGASAQYNVVLNQFTDDRGTLYVNGEVIDIPDLDSLPRIQVDDTTRVADTTLTKWELRDAPDVVVPLRAGKNVIGFKISDDGWGAGFCASIDLFPYVGIADTIITDTSWRCIPSVGADTLAWATDTNFDASSWLVPGDHLDVATTGVLAGGKTLAQTLIGHNPHWLWTPKTTYMRKEFTVDSAVDSSDQVYMLMRGYNVKDVKVYLDGQVVKTHDDYLELGWPWPTDSFAVTSLAPGKHVLAVQYSEDSTKCGGLKAALQGKKNSPTTFTFAVYLDSLTKWSFVAADGWADTTFDDAAWSQGLSQSFIDFYTMPFPDSYGFNSMYHATGTMYFRKVIEIDAAQVGIARTARTVKPASKVVVKREYYDLRGALIPQDNVKNLAKGAVVVERKIMADQRSVYSKLTIR